MKWIRGDKWHQVSECGRWIVCKTGIERPVYTLIRRAPRRDDDQIVHVGTRKECEDKAENATWQS